MGTGAMLQLHHRGHNVLEIRWSAAGDFTTIKYELVSESAS
jgi:hypothetical protein